MHSSKKVLHCFFFSAIYSMINGMSRKNLLSFIAVLVLVFVGKGWCLGVEGEAVSPLGTLITEKQWQGLSQVFVPGDTSYKVLEEYFTGVRSIKIMSEESNQMIYKAKFAKQGEFGVITFLEKDGKYSKLEIKNQIRPLYFVDSFKKYKAIDCHIRVGDADIHFVNGYFYQASPFDYLLIYHGRWKMHIKPGDREERFTLQRQYNRDYFSQSSEAGIFILPDKSFLEKMPSEGEVATLAGEAQWLFELYREGYGIHLPHYNEYWYLPFGEDTHLVVFGKEKKEKDAFYFYSYSQNAVPDTIMGASDESRMILSYNAHRGLKMSLGPGEAVSEMKLDLFFNPQTHFISGAAVIDFFEPSSLRQLTLATKINLVENRQLEAQGLNIFRKKDRYFLMGPEAKRLALFFKGHIEPTGENFELFQSIPENSNFKEFTEAPIYFLSRVQNYYPNPGDDFFKMTLNINLPGHLNCLASGNLVERTAREMSSFKFESVASKGISLVIGDFSVTHQLNSRVPIQFHTNRSFKYPRDLDFEEIKAGFEYFLEKFGSLDLSVVNVLLRRGLKEGGISNYGFIIMNVLPPWGDIARTDNTTGALRVNIVAFDKKRIHSPILIRYKLEDNLLHELAHQWWGGIISWKSYRDAWITEGMAQFSVLYYLKKHLSERRFENITRRLRRWIIRHNDSGPIVYGNRILALENRTEPYQSVVYNKTAFVFLMLMDIIGEDEVIKRLGSVIRVFKYKSITTQQFIQQFCEDDPKLSHYFKKWLFSRVLPTVELRLDINDKDYDQKSYKRVVINISQVGEKEDTDFVFPLYIKVVTDTESTVEKLIIDQEEQKFTISRSSTIRTIDILPTYSLVNERKVLQRNK